MNSQTQERLTDLIHQDARIDESLKVIQKLLQMYSQDRIGISFNGGKDCTVVLHLLRICLGSTATKVDDAGKIIAHHPKFDPDCKIQFIYFEKEGEFPEVLDFIAESEREFGFHVRRIKQNYKEGLQVLYDEGMRAILMGQRRGDPHAKDLEAFSPCTEGWPKIVRVNPILEWEFKLVWKFLRGLSLPYCKLYDDGYTSLGSVKDTARHPSLIVKNETDVKVLPAHALECEENESERAGRKNHREQQQQHEGQDDASKKLKGY